MDQTEVRLTQVVSHYYAEICPKRQAEQFSECPLLLHDQGQRLGVTLRFVLRNAVTRVLSIKSQCARARDRWSSRQVPIQIEFHPRWQRARLKTPEIVAATSAGSLHFKGVCSADRRNRQARRRDRDSWILMTVRSIQTPTAAALHA
jgi:hypothetical protein